VSDPVLVLAWLVFAHLVADFVLQNDWIAMNKANGSRDGYLALATHGLHVSLCLLPAVLAFGGPGIVYVVLVAGSHVIVDRWKVLATRRAESAGQAQARARIERMGEIPASGLGAAWTPWPGLLFLADQALHMTFAIVGWLVILEAAPLQPAWIDFANAVLRNWDRTTVHSTLLTAVVVVSLFIVNTRGAYYFVLALVSPRELTPAPDAPSVPAVAAPQGYTVRVGPLVATVEPSVAAGGVAAPAGSASRAAAAAAAPTVVAPTRRGRTEVAPGPASNGNHPSSGAPVAPVAAGAAPALAAGQVSASSAAVSPAAVPSGAPARIGATIGALERLLIVAFLLTGAEAAVGLVIAAKTIARFKQLDDRGFAEYYLLGTLASVAVAIGTALVAQAALHTLR
jgi:Protein of unknown function (DUF3307)